MNRRFENVRTLREQELRAVLPEIAPGSRLLEIGAGSGWQARLLSEHGCEVDAIDLEGTPYADQEVWPVKSYDGSAIPFPDDTFDIVFSSNVLEHIPKVREFQSEIHRVLKPDGVAIHILPSASWRIGTTLLHYPHLAKRTAAILVGRLTQVGAQKNGNTEPAVTGHAVTGHAVTEHAVTGHASTEQASTEHASTEAATAERPPISQSTAEVAAPAGQLVRYVIGLLLPERHGELGNIWTEIYYFSRLRWTRLFTSTGWRVRRRGHNGLFYTGHRFVGSRLSLQARGVIARFLGGSCHVYVLESSKSDSASPEN